MMRTTIFRPAPLLLLTAAMAAVAVFLVNDGPPAAEAQDTEEEASKQFYVIGVDSGSGPMVETGKHLWVKEDDLAEIGIGRLGPDPGNSNPLFYVFTSTDEPDECAPPSGAETLGDPLATADDLIGGGFPIDASIFENQIQSLPILIKLDLLPAESTEVFAVCIRTYDDPGLMERLREDTGVDPGDPDPEVERGWKPLNRRGERMFVHIVDQTGVVNFAQRIYTAKEGETVNASIFKTPNKSMTGKKFVASFNSSGNDTALRGVHYTADQDDEFTISKDSRMFVPYKIPIPDDNICEAGAKTFTIDLGVKGGVDPSHGMILGEPLSTTVYIYDDGDEIPDAPQWAQAKQEGGTLTMEWGSSLCDPTGHELEYRDDPTASWTSAFTNRALPAGKFTDFRHEVSSATEERYYVRVRAKNANGNSPWTYADTDDGFVQWEQGGGQNSPCDNCGTGGDTGAVAQGQGQYADLIAQMKEWRNDPEWSHLKEHTDRWDRALLAFGETVEDTTLSPMTAAEAQGFADRGWERWVEVAKALRVLENQSPTVSASIADVTIVNESGSHEVSLAGVFDDADGDGLTITAISSDEATATASVASDGSTLTVTARLRGTATITVTADDGKGGTVEDGFTVTVKAAPLVAQPLDDVSGLEMETTHEVSLVGVFRDADGDQLTITAASSDETRATATVASDGASLTLAGVAEGTAAVTVTAEDSDGNRVSDAFDVEVVKRFASLIPRMYQWRNDPQWAHHKPHTDRWDRALLALGETVADATLTPMTAAEAQALADQSWGTRWVPVAAALREIESGGQPEQTNQAPTVAAAISDATIVNEIGSQQVSLSGVFSDADNDSLAVTAASSDEAKATVSVATDYATLTVNAQARGTATITVTANDGNGGTVEDSFTVTVKAAPDVASAIADVSGLEAGSTQEVSLSGAFSDADGDTLSVTASSDDEAIATVSVAADDSALTVAGVAEGASTVTVIAQDTDGNLVMDDFAVSVVAQQQQQQVTPNQSPAVAAAISDATIVSESGSQTVSLSGVFSDADNDSLTVTAVSSDETKATVSVAADYSGLTVTAKSRGTATITVTANDGKGGTVEDSFTVTVKAAPVVASAIADMNLKAGASQAEGGAQDVTLSAVFSDADGDALTFTADTSDSTIAEAFLFQGVLTVVGLADGSATITVTAEDSDGNAVSDTFNVSVVGPPTPVSNLSCVAQTDRVLFSWDAPEWSGAAVYAYDYDLTLPDGRREQSRLLGYPAVSGKGEYQVGQEASISVKAVYELAHGSEVSSAAATLTCTVAE